MSCTVQFPARSDIRCVNSLREEWLAAIDQHHEVLIDCSAVEVMSAAAAQLVPSLAKHLASVGGSVKLIHLSDSVREDLRVLGLKDFT